MFSCAIMIQVGLFQLENPTKSSFVLISNNRPHLIYARRINNHSLNNFLLINNTWFKDICNVITMLHDFINCFYKVIEKKAVSHICLFSDTGLIDSLCYTYIFFVICYCLDNSYPACRRFGQH